MYDSGFAHGEVGAKLGGKAEGEIKGKLDTFFLILTKRLGALPESIAAKIKSLNKLDEINRLSDIALDVPTLDELLNSCAETVRRKISCEREFSAVSV